MLVDDVWLALLARTAGVELELDDYVVLPLVVVKYEL